MFFLPLLSEHLEFIFEHSYGLFKLLSIKKRPVTELNFMIEGEKKTKQTKMLKFTCGCLKGEDLYVHGKTGLTGKSCKSV